MTTTFNDIPIDIQKIIFGMKYKLENRDKIVNNLVDKLSWLRRADYHDIGGWLVNEKDIYNKISEFKLYLLLHVSSKSKREKLMKELVCVLPEGILDMYEYDNTPITN